ncbi:MAG: nucleotide pyrophosphohydrolase, partial [Candidatus Bathyarchaeota archaeon]
MYIREFQEMMERIYSHRDFKRGANGTYRWLKEEIEELGEAIQGEDKRIIEDEFADVI